MGFWKYFKCQHVILLFSFFLPISEKISTLLIVLCIVALIGEFVSGQANLNYNKALYILPLIFLVYMISVLMFSDDYRFKWFEQRASLLAFPLIFLGAGNINFHKVTQFFVYGCVTAYTLCFLNALHNSFSVAKGRLIFQPLLNETRDFFESIVFEGNYFFAEHFSFLIQTSYFGFYLTVAACNVIIYNRLLFGKNWILFLALLIVGIVQTMSLAAFWGIIIALFVLGFYLIKNRRTKSLVYAALGGILILGYFIQPRFKILMRDVIENGIELNPNGRYGMMLRMLSWDASFDIIKDNFLFGVGLPNAQKELNLTYKGKAYTFPLKQELNSHNQFLQITVECGILGTLMMLAMFFFLFKKSADVPFKEKVFIFVFTVLLLFNFSFESYFNRYVGLSFVSFFYCLLISIKEQKKVYEVYG